MSGDVFANALERLADRVKTVAAALRQGDWVNGDRSDPP